MLRAADQLDGRLHWDELNRELMRLLNDEEVDEAIERIRQARSQPGYRPETGGSSTFPLSDRCHDEDNDGNVRDHIGTPWLRRVSAAGLVLNNPGPGGDGYWSIPEDLRDIVHEAVSGSSPPFKEFTT